MATYLYHKDCPHGRVFNTDEEVQKALKEGWVDAPGKVGESAPIEETTFFAEPTDPTEPINPVDPADHNERAERAESPPKRRGR